MANLLSTTVNGSVLVGPSGTAHAYDGAATGKLYFGNQVSDSPTHYHITTNMENVGGNYSKLDIRWYTGQRFYAHQGYGGFRFKEITTGNDLFSIGYTDGHVRVENNLYVGNTIYNNGNAVIHAGNIGSQSVNYATSAGSASSSPFLSALGDYVFSASTNGRDFARGIQTSFVSASQEYPEYGSVVRIRTYTGANDGGTAELYFPYSPTYGGSSMRYRLGVYSNAGWTGWKTVIDSDNIGSQSVSNATTAGGLAVHTGRNNEANKIVRTQENGYVFFGYINSSSGNENNNSNPDRVWGTNGSDDYLRTYRTSALSVGYAASAGSASTASVAEFQSIPDARGNAYTPNAYTGQRVWWHFNNTDTVGGYGTFWHAIQTVSPWTSYDSSHRQQQIQWGGTDISFRYATSGTTWSSWFRFITDANIASQSVSYADNAGNLGGLSSGKYPKQDYYFSSSLDWNTIEAADTASAIVLRIESAVQNPPANDVYNWSLWQQGTRSRGSQIAVAAYGEPRMYFRGSNFDSGSYRSWNEIIHSGNIASNIPATLSPTNLYIGNAIYFGGANNYFNWDGARINSNVGIQSTSDMRAPIFYDSNDTTYYLDPNSSGKSLNVAGNIDLIARSASWSEGIRVRVPSTSTWGGIRFTRDRGNDDGNWAIGFTGIDSSDDLTIWANNNGDGGAMKLRIHKNGTVSVTNAINAYSFQGNANVAGTGNASYHPSGIYSTGTNWLYGTMYMNNNSIRDVQEVYNNGWFRTVGHQGLYNPTNDAHFYPNNASYGSWRIDGTRNGWHGLHFNSGSTLMMNSAETGIHREGYGWQFRWYNGSMYVSRGTYGGGTEYTVIDSGTIGSQSVNYATSSGSTSGNSNGVSITGYGNNNFTFHQTPNNVHNWGGGWASHFIGNHGDGDTYYAQSIIMPFWGIPHYQRNQGGTRVGPYYFVTQENINSQSVSYSTTSGNSSTTSQRGFDYLLIESHSDNTKGYRIYNTSNSSVSAMFTNSANALVIGAGAFDQVQLNKKVLVSGAALGVNVAASATAGRIDASNDIVAYSSSDERLKQNITPIENALDKVKSLTGVEFDWKPEYKHAHGYEGHDTGIIAQQVQEVIPSAVRTNDTGFLAVRYEKLIGLLVEGMKEQQAQIEELKAKLDGLTK